MYDEEKTVTVTSEQKHGLLILGAVQLLIIILTYLLLILQAAGTVNFAKASIFGIVIYAVMYFNFLKAYGIFSGMRAAPKWSSV
jgi:hypothetical protein